MLSARVFLLWWAVHLLSSRTGGRDQLTTLQHRGEIKRMFFPRPGKHKKKEKRKKCIYIFYTSAVPRARVHGAETHPAFRRRLLRQGLIYTISSGLYGPGPALLFPGGVEGHQRVIFFFFFLVIADKSTGRTLCGTEKEYNIKVMSIFWLNGQKTFI